MRRIGLHPNHFVAALAVALALSTGGCFAIHYSLQAGAGELTLLTQARPIDEFLERSDTPEHLRRLLESVAEVKQFGERAGLKATSSYQRYEQLDRPVAVYVVSACPELSLSPRLFHFPIAGAVPYLGWFSLRAARDFARSLEDDGLDVNLRGASAYSTLGWFDDPLLSSMIGEGPEALGALANTVLHESVHATLYLPGQTPFNEGLAETLADHLTGLYLAANASPRERNAWAEEEARRTKIEEVLHDAAARLDAIYRSPIPDDDKRTKKKELLGALAEQLRLRRPINNAMLAEHRAYAAGHAGFMHLLDACSDALPCVFAALRSLDGKSFAKPNDDQLDPILDALAERTSKKSR